MKAALPLRYGPSLYQLMHEAIVSLRLLGRRSYLAFLGILVGAASIVAVLEVGESATAEALSIFKGLGTDTLLVNLPLFGKKGRCVPDAMADFEGLLQKTPALAQMAPLALNSARLKYQGVQEHFALVGTSSALFDFLNPPLLAGRFLHEADRKEPFVVVGAQAARLFAQKGAPLAIGDVVQVESHFFQVIGILGDYPFGALIPFSVNDALIVSFQGFHRVHPPANITALLARVKEGVPIQEAANALTQGLAMLFGACAFEVQIPEALMAGVKAQSRTFSYLLIGLGLLSLLAGGLGVMNVMLMSVQARRKEIGIRIAIGARSHDIRRLFLMEALFLSLFGATGGVFVGLLIAWLFVSLSAWTFVFSPLSVCLGLASSLITGLGFGFFPAQAATRLQPIEVLRDA